MLNPHIFRAYDVRGRVGSDINPEVFRLVGRAYGTLIRNHGGRTVAVGQDNRESSAGLKAGFVEGARAAGLDIFATGAGGLSTRSPRDDYFDTIAKIVRLERPLKVVADAGNGIAGVYGPPLLRRLGCEVIELHCESDGRFPNHLPDPEDPEN